MGGNNSFPGIPHSWGRGVGAVTQTTSLVFKYVKDFGRSVDVDLICKSISCNLVP